MEFSTNNTKLKNNTFTPNITIDCLILGFHEKKMMVLLHREPNSKKWMLPWAFVEKDIDIDKAASNILFHKTGLKNTYLKQYHLFGRTNEVPIEDSANLGKINSIVSRNNNWECQRCLSLAYYALVKYEDVVIAPDQADQTFWFPFNELPSIYQDTEAEIDMGVNIIKQQLGLVPIGFELLPEKFTMPELRTIYETILDNELDRRNFQRKMLATGIIIPLNETRKSGAYKSPNLYIFDKEKYEKARKLGIYLTTFKFK